jgi:hypothetical protein
VELCTKEAKSAIPVENLEQKPSPISGADGIYPRFIEYLIEYYVQDQGGFWAHRD